MEQRIRTIIVDDHNALRQSLTKAISEDEEIEVVGTFNDPQKFLHDVDKLNPHVVLMDILMPKLNGLQAAKQLKKRSPKTRVVMFTMHDDNAFLKEALEIGVSGYVLKDSFLEDVICAIKSAYHNQLYLSPALAKRIVGQSAKWEQIGKKQFGLEILTSREKDVLKLIAEGLRIKEIAVQLNISVRTAETHRKNIMAKLDLHSVALLTRFAIKNRLVEI